MNDLQNQIGARLRLIRESILFGGVKLSVRQFAEKLNTTEDKIRNYETGRSSVPDYLLVELYKQGINPTYILTGEGSKFADNSEGIALMKKNKSNESARGDVEILSQFDTRSLTDEQLLTIINVAAGDIKKRLQVKRK
jgi:hypothetical protein